MIFDVQRGGPSTGMPTRTQQSDVLICAYASHGDTKHVLLFPEDPHECFEFAALSFDLADRLQTPIFVMLDLDIGMNEWLCKPLAWEDSRAYDRGKVLSAEELEAGREFGRYLDVDGDGVTYRTYPGTHPSRGAFFTRGTSKNRMARYSEEGADLRRNMQRLLRKFETAKGLVPAPDPHRRGGADPLRRDLLRLDGAGDVGGARGARRRRHPPRYAARARLPLRRHGDRLRARPRHVFLVEQNRDAQLRTLLINEGALDPARILPVLHYDGRRSPRASSSMRRPPMASALRRRAPGRGGMSRASAWPSHVGASYRFGGALTRPELRAVINAKDGDRLYVAERSAIDDNVGQSSRNKFAGSDQHAFVTDFRKLPSRFMVRRNTARHLTGADGLCYRR